MAERQQSCALRSPGLQIQYPANTSQPKILKEFYHAYQRGVSEIWIINVADIKPVELPFAFIMDFAWHPERMTFDYIPQYLEAFAEREFGPEHVSEIADILFEFSQLVGNRKFESVRPSTYSFLNFQESEKLLERWERLAERTRSMEEVLSPEYRTTFWHLATYQVLAGYNYHRVVLGQGQNYQYARERRNQANYVAQDVLEYFELDADYEEMYDTIEEGKWHGMLSQPKFDSDNQATWRQTSRDVVMNLSYVQLRQNMAYQFGPLGIYSEGKNNALAQGTIADALDPMAPTEGGMSPVLPTLSRYGPQSHFVEIFHRGNHRVPINWNISNGNGWLRVSQMSGQISREQPMERVSFSVDWEAIPTGFNGTVNVTVEWDALPRFDLIHVPVCAWGVPEDFHGYPDASGLISIEASHFQRKSNKSVSFERIPYLGTRSASGSVVLRPYESSRKDSFDRSSAWVEYDIYLFSASASFNATVYLTSGLDTDPTNPMRFSLNLGSRNGTFTRVLEAPETPGALPGNWTSEVQNGVWTRFVQLGAVEQGMHTIRWSVNSPEVYLEKIVLSQRAVPASYLGPPETMWL